MDEQEAKSGWRKFATSAGIAQQADDLRMCNCIGPQNGEPKCPCMMRDVVQRDGRWIERERDLGPTSPAIAPLTTAMGCICPPGAEKTCQGGLCPRRPPTGATS